MLVCSHAPTSFNCWSLAELSLLEPKVACELHAGLPPAWQTNNGVIDASSAFVIYLPCFFPSPNRADKEGFARESCISFFSL